MSYPDVVEHMRQEGFSWDILHYSSTTKPSVQQAVELVQRRVLTEMDGRDYARLLVMEEMHHCKAYTVSQEKGAVYRPKQHLEANFNKRTLVKSLQKHFQEDEDDIPLRFHQIILDYYWIPPGSWMQVHWNKSFFNTTLKELVQVLDPTDGVIYLPFCYHVVKELVASVKPVLQHYYQISFVYKQELSECLLWEATNVIDADLMQEYLGKRLDQEELYCTFGPSDVYQAMEDNHVTKREVIQVLRLIEDLSDVRMIRLKPIIIDDDKAVDGGFVGLAKDASEVERGFDWLDRSRFVSSSKGGDETSTTASETDSSNGDFDNNDDDDEPPKQMIRKKRGSSSNQNNKLEHKTRLYNMARDLEIYQQLGVCEKETKWYEICNPSKHTEWPNPQSYQEMLVKEPLYYKKRRYDDEIPSTRTTYPRNENVGELLSCRVI
jgi:hypothetical protein